MSNYLKIVLNINKAFQDTMSIPFKVLFSSNKNNKIVAKSASDEDSIRSDWNKIGNDIRKGILVYDRRITK
ncbi:hypothetical protein DY138_00615 [Apilactobacillus timberlakei]|uniref:hypothetical protein n=1 Tax=Apilactobacillus timberlakei TaxID=2008380 RepID=UPI00112CCFD5|nr:hypothetical protein [Apilactobacillus timberlakei]TPR19972.1 hypothetical protein DY138_00615 [Apilactobacillus timberlakei]TPR21690.1 hypothetical protein DY061_00530 [Apilactobacillus timberlakei]TPR22936.1 hypothetical protein DY083_02350 [Apilactobacillus timberlakei]